MSLTLARCRHAVGRRKTKGLPGGVDRSRKVVLGRLVLLGQDGLESTILPVLRPRTSFGTSLNCDFRPTEDGEGHNLRSRFAPKQIALEIDIAGRIYLHNILKEAWISTEMDVVVLREEDSFCLGPQQVMALQHRDTIVLSGCLYFRWEDVLLLDADEAPQLSHEPTRWQFSDEASEGNTEDGLAPSVGLPTPSLSSPKTISSLDGALWLLSRSSGGSSSSGGAGVANSSPTLFRPRQPQLQPQQQARGQASMCGR